MERAMENPPAIVYAETQHEVALMTEETGVLEELPYECLSPSAPYNDDEFATCSVSDTYSDEGAAIIDPSKKNNFPQPATGEGSAVVETEFQIPLISSIVPPNQGMNVLGGVAPPGPRDSCRHLPSFIKN